MSSNPCSLSVAQLAEAIRNRKLSVVEVVEAHLRRIEAVNPVLNAVVAFCGDTALDQAKAADLALAQNQAVGPLHGVPMTIKDSLDTVGVVSTWGTPGRANFIPAGAAHGTRHLAGGLAQFADPNRPPGPHRR